MHLTGRYASRLGLLTAATALAWPLAAITPAQGATPAVAHQPVTRSAAGGAGRMIPAVGHPIRFRNTGFRARHIRPDLVIPCESNTATVQCYEPRQIRMAYNVPGGLTGAGRSITIIDAFQSPTISADLAAFSKLFNLARPKLRIIAPQGLTPFNSNDPDQVGWAGEISLDVEWAHAIAPGAKINLVLARSDQDKDIFAAQRYVIRHNLGDVLSQSFGEAERCMRPRILKGTHELFKEAAAERMTVFASSGDFGSAQPTCNGSSFFEAASSPASDPRVTGVGGTKLQAGFPDGDYEGETTWNDSIGSSGGGYSVTFSRPRFQRGFGRPQHRGVPDVSYNASVNGGVLVVWSSSGQGAGAIFVVGGTSAGSPQWAAIVAMADQAAHRRLGDINPALYKIGRSASYHTVFHDITKGSNIWGPSGVTAGFRAHPRWDAVTGLGSPDIAKLIRHLTAR